MPEVSHTSNKWEKDGTDRFTISNKVYKMTYNIYERSSWRNDTVKYDVRWNIYTNRPDYTNSYKVAGQERVCATRGKPRNTYKAELRRIRTLVYGNIAVYTERFGKILYGARLFVAGLCYGGNAESSDGKAGREKAVNPKAA